jgi:plastin-1
VKDHPEMIALMNQNEDLNKFLTLTPEDSLFRWFNWHLRNAGVPRNVRSNISQCSPTNSNFDGVGQQLHH